VLVLKLRGAVTGATVPGIGCVVAEHDRAQAEPDRTIQQQQPGGFRDLSIALGDRPITHHPPDSLAAERIDQGRKRVVLDIDGQRLRDCV
jgi:hypothetical protein